MAGVEAATASKVQEEVAKASMDTVGPVEGAKAANHTVSRAEDDKVFIKYPSGATYFGEMRNGEPHGYGKLTRPNGSQYIGEFKNGKKHGQGVWLYGQKADFKYIGGFEADKKQGYGKDFRPDGSTFEGQYKNSRPDGFGVSTFPGPTGWEIRGVYQAGTLQGNGTHTNRLTLSVFEGEYKDGKRNGIGYEKRLKFGTSLKGAEAVTFEELRKFILKTPGTDTRGTWKDGKRHGRFSIIENGVEEICYYENGEKRK